MNKKLYIQNKHLTELAIRGNLSEKNPKSRNGEEEEMGDEGRNAEYGGDIEEQTKRVNNKITKCFYHENSDCINENCKF